MQFNKLDKAMLLMLLIALCVRVPFLFIVPMVEAPDEFAHFWVTKFLSEHFAAPNAQEVVAGGPSAVYGSLPPFAYMPHVLFVQLLAPFFPGLDISFTERIGSILGGLVTVFAACQIGKLIFASNNLLRLALPLCVALHPQLVFVNAYCNSDSTACALASLLLLVSLSAIYRGAHIRYAVFAGVLSALIALSKFSALAVVPAAFVGIVCACWIYKLNVAQTSMRLCIFAGTAAIVCVPWFARNAAVFGGDWLGTNTMRESWANTFNRSVEPVSLSSVLKQKVWWQQLFCSFWAVYGYQKHYLPAAFYVSFLAMLVASMIGAFTQFSQMLKKKTAEHDINDQAAWLVLSLSVIFSWAGLLYAAVNNLGGPQGRYLFPSEISFMAIILFGLGSSSGFFQKVGKWLVFTFVCLNAITLIYSMYMLYSMFGMRLKPY
ncbi:MAG: hypothetical protein C0507_09785 [Cyanobacteria bacterium PR.3.49]|nr:hypothetical protein [Cyanobacteria bacterium PR.3.49]